MGGGASLMVPLKFSVVTEKTVSIICDLQILLLITGLYVHFFSVFCHFFPW